jgi:hypothetical protein
MRKRFDERRPDAPYRLDVEWKRTGGTSDSIGPEQVLTHWT